MPAYFIILFIFISNLAWSFGLESSHELSAYKNFYKEKYENYFYFLGNYKYNLNSSIKLNYSPELQFIQYDKDKSDAFNYTTHKGSLDLETKKTLSRLGYFQIKKEGPDIFDPLNHVQNSNYFDPLHIRQKSLLGLYSEFAILDQWSIELVYVPKNTVPTLPKTTSAWFPEADVFPTASNDYIVHLPENIQYVITKNNPDCPESLNNNVILKSKFSYDSTDFIIQYDEMLSNNPTVSPELTGTLISANPILEIELDNPVRLSFTWEKVRNYGLGIIHANDYLGIILKYFVNYQKSSLYSETFHALAIEKQYSEAAVVLEKSFVEKKYFKTTDSSSTFGNLFKNATALGLRYSATDNLNFLIGTIYDHETKSSIVYIKPKYQITDSLSTDLQLIGIDGTEKSLLSFFRKSDSASFGLTYLF